MANFVLVAGAWLGSWAWDDVTAELRAAGHRAYPLTLSGLADKRDLPAGQQIHVQDIVGEIERLDLRDVVLVGHSYAGIPVGQAAGRIIDRLERVIFVDANLPSHGESLVSGWSETGRAYVETSMAQNAGFWPAPAADDYAGHGLTEQQVARIVAGATPHPGSSITEPAMMTRALGDLPLTYIKCLLDSPTPTQDVLALLERTHWRLENMTGHWPMFSQPRELARVFIDSTRPRKPETRAGLAEAGRIPRPARHHRSAG